jgi:hypothetical protein
MNHFSYEDGEEEGETLRHFDLVPDAGEATESPFV